MSAAYQFLNTNELLLEGLSYLSAKDLQNVRLVCRQINYLVKAKPPALHQALCFTAAPVERRLYFYRVGQRHETITRFTPLDPTDVGKGKAIRVLHPLLKDHEITITSPTPVTQLGKVVMPDLSRSLHTRTELRRVVFPDLPRLLNLPIHTDLGKTLLMQPPCIKIAIKVLVAMKMRADHPINVDMLQTHRFFHPNQPDRPHHTERHRHIDLVLKDSKGVTFGMVVRAMQEELTAEEKEAMDFNDFPNLGYNVHGIVEDFVSETSSQVAEAETCPTEESKAVGLRLRKFQEKHQEAL